MNLQNICKILTTLNLKSLNKLFIHEAIHSVCYKKNNLFVRDVSVTVERNVHIFTNGFSLDSYI